MEYIWVNDENACFAGFCFDFAGGFPDIIQKPEAGPADFPCNAVPCCLGPKPF